MQRICLFPGTFDPLTLGHVDIITRSLPLFDKIVVGIGINTSKAPMFTPEKRLSWVKEIFKNEPKVEGAVYEGLTVNFCRKIDARFILEAFVMSVILNTRKQLLMPIVLLINQLKQFFLQASLNIHRWLPQL
jgi:pantetheine-phosphate adenylyltransferase